MTNSNLTFKPINKDRLFYDLYHYCCRFQLQEVSCLREKVDHAVVDTMLERRKSWREVAEQRWQNMSIKSNTPGFKDILSIRRWNEITPDVEKNLHDLVDLLLGATSDYKLVLSVDRAWLYTNDSNLINQCKNMRILRSKSYTEAVIARPKNTIRLKNSYYNFRSYFAITKLTNQQKIDVVNFLSTQSDSIRISPSLSDWISDQWYRTQDYYFIDHIEMSWLTMFALVRPGLIRKTLQIIPAK